MKHRARRQAGQGIPVDVIARVAAVSHIEREAVERQDRAVVVERARARNEAAGPDWQVKRTLIFAAAAFVVMMAVVLRDAASEGSEPFDETTGTLPAFVADGPPRHDGPDEVILERFERVDDATIRIAGWAAETDRIEVLAEGQVVATVPITVERLDTALEHGLGGTAFVGFDAEVEVQAGSGSICVARPDQLPGVHACDRPMLDMASQRVIAFYGVPYAPRLGTLGDGEPEEVLARLDAQAEPFRSDRRPVMLAFEVIATVAQASPGSDGNYSASIAKDGIWTFVDTIRAVGGIMVIDFQTGRDTYLDQVPDYVDFLSQPDVHIALDPEWDMEAGEVPNEVIGSSDAEEINEVMEFVADIVREHRLPRKVMVVHNFTDGMIANRDLLAPPPEIDLVIHMDGHGPPQNKIGVYDRLAANPPIYNGFKLFYQRDFPLMTTEAVLALDPGFVSFQ
jgi:hypothetical protein